MKSAAKKKTVMKAKTVSNLRKVLKGSMKVDISERTGKPKIVRKDNGREAAAKEATMTKDEWRKFQAEKYSKAWPKPEYMHEKGAFKTTYVRDGGEGAYKDKTYEIVTRWTAKTRIAFRPHAKAPGSKSHIRYENYAVAKTVGQALELGCYPMDWCFDYEHGFIKVLGGDVREEPLDISKVDDESKLTEVDRCLVHWFRRELAKRYDLKIADLLVEKGGGESVLMRAHRLVADRKAGELIKQATKTNRAISDDDMETVLSTWAFAKNAARQNVIPDGQSWVWSDNVGLVRDRNGDIHLTSACKRYPSFTTIINMWLSDRLPKEVQEFKWTSLNLNCNYAAKRHRDGNNFGPSMIKAFGPFKGGALSCFPGDDKSVELSKLKPASKKTIDIRTHLAMFNGNAAHEVDSFSGNRYSVVFFAVGCHAQAPQKVMSELKSLGFAVPHRDEDPHAILGAPGPQKSKPTLRTWVADALGKTLKGKRLKRSRH